MGCEIQVISLRPPFSACVCLDTLGILSLLFRLCGREALFTPVLPLEAVLADKTSEGGSFIHPSIHPLPPGLGRPLRPGKAVCSAAKFAKASRRCSLEINQGRGERENELKGRAGFTMIPWGTELRIEKKKRNE